MAKPSVPAAVAASTKAPPKLAMTAGMGRARRSIGSPIGNLLILCLLLMIGVASFPSLLLFCFGMLPSGVAYVIDRNRRWALTFTVFMPNLAATGIFLTRLLMDGASVNGVMDMMSNPYVWCLIYMSAGMGWAIYFSMPMLVTSAKEYRLDLQRAGYEDALKALREEWGEEIEPPAIPEPPTRSQQRRR